MFGNFFGPYQRRRFLLRKALSESVAARFCLHVGRQTPGRDTGRLAAGARRAVPCGVKAEAILTIPVLRVKYTGHVYERSFTIEEGKLVQTQPVSVRQASTLWLIF